MKSVKMFGKKIPILVILVIVMISGAGAYGAVVSYLSKKAIVTTTVVSPIVVKGEILRMPNQGAIDAVVQAADRLVELQSSIDYGWDWEVTGLVEHSGGASSTNLYGVTALGLIDAYTITGELDYYYAAKDVADHMIANEMDTVDFYRVYGTTEGTEYVTGFDFMFLMEFAEISEDTGYSDEALSNWNYQKTNDRTVYGNLHSFTIASEVYDAMLGRYGTSLLGGVLWHASEYGLAAIELGDTDFADAMAALVAVNYLDMTPSDDQPIVGWAKTLEFLSTIDSELYSDEILDIVGILEEFQDPHGLFVGYSPVQDTAYAVMGLKVADKTVTAEKGAGWFLLNQEPNGGWLESNDIEYAEVDSEVLQAIADVTSIEETHIASFDTSEQSSTGLGTIMGGDTILATGTEENLANNPVTAVVAVVIPAPTAWDEDGWTTTGDEMELYWRYPGETEWNLMGFDSGWDITADNNYAVILVGGYFTSDMVTAGDGSTIPAGGSMTVEVRFDFAQNVALGTYTFEIFAVHPGTSLESIPTLIP